MLSKERFSNICSGSSKLGERTLFRVVPILQEFKYVFPIEFLGLPPKREIAFKIELKPSAK